MTDHGTRDEESETQEVRTNALRGLWRALARTAKRPVLAILLLRMRTMEIEEICDLRVLRRLRWAWANPNSGAVEYLVAVAKAAATTQGSVLECGSGLSTVVIGAISQRTGNPVVSLENSSWWARHVRLSLRLARAEDVDYRVRGLRSFGNFDWYDLDTPVDDVTLVICDGPIVLDHVVDDSACFLCALTTWRQTPGSSWTISTDPPRGRSSSAGPTNLVGP